MIFKQTIFVVILVIMFLSIPALLILSLKSDTESLKRQVSTLQEFIDSQKKWNEIPTEFDLIFDGRIDILEQKMRKVYGGYDVEPIKFYDKSGKIILIIKEATL